MTHETDCTVKVGKEQVLERVQHRIENEPNITDVIAAIEDEFGWTYLGGGMGRKVFQVSDARPDEDEPTRSAPCVVKFASSKHGRGSGYAQNKDEVNTFLRLPTSVKNAEPPIVAPVKDWDEQYRWVSMPLADSSEPLIQEDVRKVSSRLAKHGWRCGDLNGQNVALMHDAPVLIDYGIRCHEVDTAIEHAEQWETRLKQLGIDGGARAFAEDGWDENMRARVEWENNSLGTEGAIAGGSYADTGLSGFRYAAVSLGPWDDADRLWGAVTAAQNEVEDAWAGVNVSANVQKRSGGRVAEYTVDVHPASDGDVFPVEMFEDLYDDLVEATESAMASKRVNPTTYGQQVARAIFDTEFAPHSAPTSVEDAGTAFVRFDPPYDVIPAYKVGAFSSEVLVNPEGVASAEFVYGPWDGSEVSHREVSLAANETFDMILDADLGLEPSFEIIEEPSGEGHDDLYVAFAFQQWPDDPPVEPAVIGRAYETATGGILAVDPVEDPVEASVAAHVEAAVRDREDDITGEFEVDMENADGDRERAERVLEAYDAFQTYRDDDKGETYYTLYEDDVYIAIVGDDGGTRAAPFEEWIYGSWTWSGGLFDWGPVDYREDWEDEFWRTEDVVHHATDPESAARIVLSGGLDTRRKTRGTSNQNIGAAIFAARSGNWNAQHYGDAMFHIDVAGMDADGNRPGISMEPGIAEPKQRELIANMLEVEGFWAEMPHDVDEDTVVLHDPVPLEYLSLDTDEETFEKVLEHVSLLEDDFGPGAVENAVDWLESQR